jgi:hypothetical protein
MYVIVLNLHCVQEMNAYRADHVRPSVRLAVYIDSIIAVRILIKFPAHVMPMEGTKYLYFLISYNR